MATARAILRAVEEAGGGLAPGGAELTTAPRRLRGSGSGGSDARAAKPGPGDQLRE